MSTSQPDLSRTRRHRRRRLVALTAVAGVAIRATAIGAGPAAAAPVSVSGASFEWGLSTEVQSSNPAPGTCPYFSAGQSDGTETTYQTTAGNVTVVKDGAAPTW